MSAEQKLNELAELARYFGGEEWQYTQASLYSNGYITGRGGRTIVQTSGGDVPANVCRYIQMADPETIVAIAEAFADMKQRAESAEAENNRLSRNYQSVIEQNMPRTGDGCDEGWSRVIEAQELQQKLTAAEAIVADVEEVINLLSEREWAEHCTKTDTGKRLEEAITELHNEAAPDEQPAPPVFGYMRVVSGQSFQIMEGTQRPPDRSGNGAGPWFAIYRQPPAPVVPADLLAHFTRHRLMEIIVTGPDASGAEQNSLARIALNFYPKPPEQQQ